MNSVEIEVLTSVFLPPEAIAIEAISPTQTHLTIHVSCRLKSAACPLCQHSSERIHGRYGRTVADMPCGGRRVTLALTVRKLVCGTAGCPRKIFTERLPALVEPSARMTNRLSEVLQTLGFATCGELGERFAPQLGMQVSGPTLLRRMRMRCCPALSSVRILGIDDWSGNKGVTYGTIVVDFALRKPIELLPDRSAETSQAWLRTHPEVEVVSRDRGTFSKFLLPCLPSLSSNVASPQHVHPGSSSVSRVRSMRNNASLWSRSERAIVIWRWPIDWGKDLGCCWQRAEVQIWMPGSHKRNTVAFLHSKKGRTGFVSMMQR